MVQFAKPQQRSAPTNYHTFDGSMNIFLSNLKMAAPRFVGSTLFSGYFHGSLTHCLWHSMASDGLHNLDPTVCSLRLSSLTQDHKIKRPKLIRLSFQLKFNQMSKSEKSYK